MRHDRMHCPVRRGLNLLVLLALMCAPAAAAPIRAYVSILPLAEFAERTGGERVQVDTLVPPGQSPHTYEVTPRQMAQLAQAEVFFSAGVPFERMLLPKLKKACPNLRIVDTRQGMELLDTDALGTPATQHGDEAHEHGGADPHVWLDPLRAKSQAAVIAGVFRELRPEVSSEIEANLKTYSDELDALCAEVRSTLAPVEGRTLYAYHPAYVYFTERFGLKQVSVEREGKEPGLRHVQELAGDIRAQGVKTLFVQPQFSRKLAEVIAKETGVRVVSLDPLAKEYAANLRHMAEAVREGLSP